MNEPARKLATIDDLPADAEERRLEILDGEISEKAAPTFEHGDAQGGLIWVVKGAYQFGGGGGAGPGGWWIAPEVDIQLGVHDLVRPDIAGWRKSRSPKRPTGWPVALRPDWICEVVSGDKRRDHVKKKRIYHRAQLPHYWLADPEQGTLTVLRWSADGFVEILIGERGEVVRAEPFDAIEIDVGLVLGEAD